MGHVIGLEHSANKRSIMFPTEHPNALLQESDKAMCRYSRYRWSSMNQKQAQEKTGVISNGGYDGNDNSDE
jgi:predicted Zn-dependent protease